MEVVKSCHVNDLVRIDTVTLQKSRNHHRTLLIHLYLISQKVSSFFFPWLTHQSTTVKSPKQCWDIIISLHCHNSLFSEFRCQETFVKFTYFVLMLMFYFLKMLDQTHHSRKTQTSEEIYNSITSFIKGSSVVKRILDNPLRISWHYRNYRTYNVSTFCQINELLGLLLRSNHKKPIFDDTDIRIRKDLKSRKPWTRLEIFP